MTERNRLLVGLFPTMQVQAAIEAHRKDWWWPRDCSFPPEGFSLQVRGRRWNPHVTIARDAERAARPMSLKPIRWTATEFRLVRSHFTHPFRHEALASYPLH